MGADEPENQTMRNSDWSELRHRVRRRIIFAIDLASIVILDAVILVLGSCLTLAVEHLTPNKNEFLRIAINFSDGTFLFLYVIVSGFHIYEFVKLGASENQ